MFINIILSGFNRIGRRARVKRKEDRVRGIVERNISVVSVIIVVGRFERKLNIVECNDFKPDTYIFVIVNCINSMKRKKIK